MKYSVGLFLFALTANLGLQAGDEKAKKGAPLAKKQTIKAVEKKLEYSKKRQPINEELMSSDTYRERYGDAPTKSHFNPTTGPRKRKKTDHFGQQKPVEEPKKRKKTLSTRTEGNALKKQKTEHKINVTQVATVATATSGLPFQQTQDDIKVLDLTQDSDSEPTDTQGNISEEKQKINLSQIATVATAMSDSVSKRTQKQDQAHPAQRVGGELIKKNNNTDFDGLGDLMPREEWYEYLSFASFDDKD
jgi:hypothetical protein